MKKITIYTAAIIETGSDHPFGWSLQAATPEDLARKVEEILAGEEKERNIEIRRPDLAAMAANAQYGSDGEPDVYNIDDDRYIDAAFIVQYSGPVQVDIPETDSGALVAAPAGEEETIDVLLSEGRFPRARAAKIEELVEEGAVNDAQEAERLLDQTPITLELIYEKGSGLFAVETEAVESADCARSPYSGKDIVTPE